MKISKIENLTDFPIFAYQGYLWYSNQKKPKILDREIVTSSDLTELPYVVEGLLFAENEGISIRITNIDGRYVIAKMEISDYQQEDVKTYLLDDKKFDGRKKIQLYQHYEKVADPINDSWLVLKPTWFAFLGFKN